MIKDHFSTQSSEYSRFRPTYPAALFDWLAQQTSERISAWDCACGNGQASTELAARFERVTATDISEAQLSHAPSLPNVDWRLAAAEESGLEAASVNLITVAQALHWFDLPRFWAEAWRVLKPNGVLAAWSYGVFKLDNQEVEKVCHHFYEDVVGDFWPPERRIVEAGYGELEFPFPEIIAPAFEMRMEWSLEELVGYMSSWSATARYIRAHGASPVPELGRKLRPLWGVPRVTVSWPLSIRIAKI